MKDRLLDCDDEDALCHIEGDQSFPVTRGELNHALKVIRRVYLLPMREALAAEADVHAAIQAKIASLDSTINDPQHGLESIRWWLCRFAWGAISLGAGLMAVGHFVKTMGWI